MSRHAVENRDARGVRSGANAAGGERRAAGTTRRTARLLTVKMGAFPRPGCRKWREPFTCQHSQVIAVVDRAISKLGRPLAYVWLLPGGRVWTFPRRRPDAIAYRLADVWAD